MSNPTGPGQPDETTDEVAESPTSPINGDTPGPDAETEILPEPDPEQEPATEVMAPADPQTEDSTEQPGERRYTAPSGFDARSTQIIKRPADPATEVFSATASGQGEGFAADKSVTPQLIPSTGEAVRPPGKKRNWGWVAAIVLAIAVLAAIATLGTYLLTRTSAPAVSQEDLVRTAIEKFDVAVQNGDLSTLRGITCGATRDNYVRYDEKAWSDTHSRVAAAKQYPVVASIDQVVINGDHAEANVTTFMAYAPQTRSTRSFDLEFRDDQWKICQAPAG
ncbi:MAG: DUF4878 domain-containing protein [Actinomycetia bacterium]|nr:DUF4878 domain-containing protein [Actinomycetes bacterium]